MPAKRQANGYADEAGSGGIGWDRRQNHFTGGN